MSATTTQLLSSGEFCKLRYDTIPVKSASANYVYRCTVHFVESFNLLASELFFLILAHPVYKMGIIQEPIC